MKLFPRLAPWAFVALLPLLSGCQMAKSEPIPGSALSPTNPDSVQILTQSPERNFRVVGVVRINKSAASLESKKSTERKFQVLAANLGAQAVIIDIMPVSTLTRVLVKGEGRAIVWDNRPRE